MIQIVKANLLTSDCDVIVHQSNCKMGFGSGIAGQIRKLFPEAYAAFYMDNRYAEQKLGSFSSAYCESSHQPKGCEPRDRSRYVYNVYGQFNYGAEKHIIYTNYEALEKGIRAVLAECKPHWKVGLPFLIGCGLANGDWGIVNKMLLDVSEETGIDLYLYQYDPK